MEIPQAGMVFDYLGEDILITREDFGLPRGGDQPALVQFDLFAEVINNKKAPQHWRVGLHNGQVALFARANYKITGTTLHTPPEPEAPEDAGESDVVVLDDIQVRELSMIPESQLVDPNTKILATIPAGDVESSMAEDSQEGA